jgi:glycosyltransferase involved in cell wall biosynthesis
MPTEPEDQLPLPAAGPDYLSDTTAAAHPYGVLYQGPWETAHDGSCRAVRLHARALASTGLPVLLKSFNHSVLKDGVAVPVFEVDVDPAVRAEVHGLVDASIAQTLPMIRHLVPRSAESLRQILVPRSVVAEGLEQTQALRSLVMRTNIVFSVWERDVIPAELAQVLSRAAACWVPCVQNATALEASGVPANAISVVPHPFDPIGRLAVEGPRRQATGRKDFLAIGLWQPRKAYHELLGAFLRTFHPDEATLTIKTTPSQWPGYPTPAESLRGWLEDDRVKGRGWTLDAMKGRVRLILRRISEDEIIDLHLASNIYVSPSHGEAWGLGAYDAKVAGNRLVHVPWGGTADFCDSLDLAIPYHLAPVDESYRWEEGTHWAVYDEGALETALALVEPPQHHVRPDWFEDCFSLTAVGAKMARLVLEVADRIDHQAAAYLRSQRR